MPRGSPEVEGSIDGQLRGFVGFDSNGSDVCAVGGSQVHEEGAVEVFVKYQRRVNSGATLVVDAKIVEGGVATEVITLFTVD